MENLDQKIKLPSNWMLVNPDSIWRHMISISKSGNIFTKEQLIKSGLYTTNDDNISRNLSYLKYLGIVEEERGKGKDQRFKVIDKIEVKNIFYELKAGREVQAKEKFKSHLEKHTLFQTLEKDFFKNERTKTLNELEHFLKDGIPGKAPQYYQKGGEFLIKLLSLASLAKISGNDISLKDENKQDENNLEQDISDTSVTPIIEDNKSALPVPTIKQNFEDAHIIISDKYTVQFTGPGMDAKYEIQEEDDLTIVEAVISKIKKKIKISETR